MIHVLNRRALPAFILLSLASCSSPSAVSPQPSTQTTAEFSDQDKRVARALSIGGEKIDGGDETPQFQALVCRLALEEIQRQMETPGGLSAEQQQAFEQARKLFDRRAAAGLSDAELSQNRARAQENDPEVNESARIAMGCLRDII